MKAKESDWKVFSKHVPEWRERHLERINREIADLLTDRERTPTECFWNTFKKMKEERRILVDCFDNHSRSRMSMSLVLMHRHGIIEDADLNDFSGEIRKWVHTAVSVLDD